jgi:sigma-E factor negative regulatory protein RseC
MDVNVVNALGARVGERVLIKMDSSPLLKATFLVYMVPILMLLLGAGLGQWVSHSAGSSSSALAAVFGFLFLAAGLALVRAVANRLAQNQDYRPRIVRIIGTADALPAEPKCP